MHILEVMKYLNSNKTLEGKCGFSSKKRTSFSSTVEFIRFFSAIIKNTSSSKQNTEKNPSPLKRIILRIYQII